MMLLLLLLSTTKLSKQLFAYALKVRKNENKRRLHKKPLGSKKDSGHKTYRHQCAVGLESQLYVTSCDDAELGRLHVQDYPIVDFLE